AESGGGSVAGGGAAGIRGGGNPLHRSGVGGERGAWYSGTGSGERDERESDCRCGPRRAAEGQHGVAGIERPTAEQRGPEPAASAGRAGPTQSAVAAAE